MKKYILLGAMAAFLASANIVHDSAREISPHSKIEMTTLGEEVFGKKGEEVRKKLEELTKEMRLTHDDEIYATIWDVYNDLNKEGWNIPEYITKRLIRKVANIESWDYPKAIGSSGERGLMQMMKESWYMVEDENFERNAFNPYKNIKAAIKYFILIKNFLGENYPNWERLPNKEKIAMLVASYNGGYGNLMWKKWNISKMEPVTREYIKKINKNIDWILSTPDI